LEAALLFMLFSFAALLIYTLKFIHRDESPLIKSKVTYSATPPTLALNRLNFRFSITGYLDGTPIQPDSLLKILKVTISLGRRFVDSKNMIKEELEERPARPCKFEDFLVNGENVLSRIHLTDLTLGVCGHNLTGFDVHGEALNAKNQFLKVLVRGCEKGCRKDHREVIDSGKLRLKLGWTHASVDERNFTYPFKFFFVNNAEFPIFYTQSFQRKYFWKRVTVYSDVGYFKTSMNKEEGINLDRSFVEDKVRSYEDPYVSLEFYSSHHELKITRVYEKIPEILSGIGGIVSLVSTVIRLVYKFYNKSKLRLHLLNKSLLKVGRKDHPRKLFFSDIPGIYFFKFLKAFGLQSCLKKQTAQNAALFNIGGIRVNEHLEIKNVINNARDIQFFKKIFFDKYQLACLDLIELNSLLIDDDEYLDHEDHSEIESVEQAYYEFFKSSNNQHLNDSIDMKLNHFMDKYIEKMVLEKYGEEGNVPEYFMLNKYKKMRRGRMRKHRRRQKREVLIRALSQFQVHPLERGALEQKGLITQKEEAKLVNQSVQKVNKRIKEMGTILKKLTHKPDMSLKSFSDVEEEPNDFDEHLKRLADEEARVEKKKTATFKKFKKSAKETKRAQPDSVRESFLPEFPRTYSYSELMDKSLLERSKKSIKF
jgi:hypothetical protein